MLAWGDRDGGDAAGMLCSAAACTCQGGGPAPVQGASPPAWLQQQLTASLPALDHDLRAGEFPGEEVRADGGAPQHH